MAIRNILHYPDPRLRQKALPVDRITPEITKLIDDMAETMYAAPGVGLAATQIGEAHRIFLVDVAAEDEPSNLLVFVNPEIVSTIGAQTGAEGCLSFPGVTEEIKRGERIRVRALDRRGQTFELEADGLLAVAIQHEYDHLDGVLMIDRVGMLKKRIIQRKMQKRAAEAES
jgi:peptide deformylase